MSEDVSCSDTSFCLLRLIRKKYLRQKNNVYNVKTGKIVNSPKTKSVEDTTYVKYDKYRPSINEGMAANNNNDGKHSRANIYHQKLQNNLTKSNAKTTSPEFIDELEKNSKEIENIFPKCKILTEEKHYKHVKNALRVMFVENSVLGLPSNDGTIMCDSKKIRSKNDTGDEKNYDHIATALEMIQSTEATLTLESRPNTNSERQSKSEETKLQLLVEDVMKKKSPCTKNQESTKSDDDNVRSENTSSVSGDVSSDSRFSNNETESEKDERFSRIENENESKYKVLKMANKRSRKKKKIRKHSVAAENLENSKYGRDSDSSRDIDENTSNGRSTQTLSKIKTESSLLYGSTRNSSDHLDAILLQMRDASDKKKELEKEQTETLATLREKQNELQYRTNCSASEKIKICQTIEALQSKIRELEKKMELQNVQHEELQLEMASFKRSSQQRSCLLGNYTTGGSSWTKPNASNQEVQTSPESNASELTYLDRLTPSTSNSYDSGNVYESRPTTYRVRPHVHGCPINIAPSSSYVDLHHASLDPSARYPINTNTACMTYWSQSEPPCTCPVGSDQDLPSTTPSNESACSDDSGIQNISIPSNSNITVDIDKIMAKIDQDNRILAELDKTRSTIATQGSMTAEQLRNMSEMGMIPPGTCQTMLPIIQQQSGLPSTMNPPISLSNTFPSYLQQYDMGRDIRPSMASMFPMQLQQMSQIPSQSTFNMLPSGYQGNYSQMSNILQSQFELGNRNMKNGNIPGSGFASSSDLLLPHEDLIEGAVCRMQEMIEIPGKGLCNIFIAKYSYDPFSQSTNVCPEAELAINAGDYLLVYGEPDDDGYVDAELMDGRRGLVPIIFIQKLSGDELLEFNQKLLIGMKEGDDSASTTIPQDIEHYNTDEHGKKFRPEYIMGTTTEDEEDVDDSESVPAPKQLTLERQLNKSILIRWNAPDDSPSHCIDSYHVYVDGVLKTTVKANERTKALLEGVDSNKPHRISVRSVTQNRRTSRDAACTMLIGKEVPAYPTNVRAHHVTATSAVISWMPSNSNYQHTVCVNNVEVRTVKPGVYRHTITGLVPNTIYRVTVRAKNIRALQFDDKSASDKYASHIDFRTLPKGMPDPPSDIQVEIGPQDGTLLVTWIPVIPENSNGAPITGYAVYADGKKVTDIDSPTGDHALIDINKIISLNPRHVTVRTKSKENQSCDSNPTQIPASAIKAKHHSSKNSNYNRPSRNAYGQIIIDPEENLSDKEVYPSQTATVPAIEITKENQGDENYSEEEFLETHRSNRNMRYNPPPTTRTHGAPRSHLERGRPPPPHSGHDRALPRPNYDARPYETRRDNREYHHSPSRTLERRSRAVEQHLSKTGRGPIQQSISSTSNRHHGVPNTATPDDKSRLVVALFDYDPATMSPNPGTSHEELAFLAGDQIKILSEKDPDGFYWGECHGKRGYVPQNMITDLENAPKTLLDKIKKRGRYIDIRHSADAKKMVALYDYDPHESSPNPDSDVEISFREGQIIYVKGEPDDDGFYLGEVDGMQGLVPSNYLQEIEEYAEDVGPAHGQNRGPVRPMAQRDRNRGHGPGARGPPPPPRDGMPPRTDQRDRRKDSRPQYENQQDQMRTLGRTNEIRHLEKRIGRDMQIQPPTKGDLYGNLSTRENHTNAIASTTMQNANANRGSFRTNRTRGTPHVIPDLTANHAKPVAPPTSGTGLKFPESPNIMQKLSEITSGATENPVDNILLKGKELIFMKFGLGK